MKLRAPKPADLAAVYEVIVARQTADLGEVEFTLENVDDEWRMSEFELVRDARVVADEQGRIVAYGLVRLHGALGMVAPAAEGKGAGTLLIEWLEDRERGLGRRQHRQFVAAGCASAEMLLRARGYERVRSSLRMEKQLTDADTHPIPRDGVAVRRFDVEHDLRAAHALDDRAFSQDPGYTPESLAFFEEEHVRGSDSAPELSYVAVEGDKVVGFLLSCRKLDQDVGFIDVLAVDPTRQSRGIGRALLTTAFADYAASGLASAQLGVSSVNPSALHLYESAGMTTRFRHDIYERAIP